MNRIQIDKHAGTITALLTALAMTTALQGCVPLIVAGVGTSVAATLDRRSYGTQLEDTEIEARFGRQVGDRFGDRVHVGATAFNRWVLLTGQVPDEAAKSEIQRITAALPNVRSVINELVVGPIASFSIKSNDGLLTSKVKARLFENRDVPSSNIKVQSEWATVFLMGLVTEREANAAVEIARTTSGAQKVVRVFEIVTEEQARQLAPGPLQQSPAPVRPAG